MLFVINKEKTFSPPITVILVTYFKNIYAKRTSNIQKAFLKFRRLGYLET